MSELARTYEAPARRGAARAAGALLRRWLGAAWGMIACELRIRRDSRRLLEAEPDMLKDLGIARADVERIVRYGRDAGR
jgi:uncharacterized protein YjiS (DUF1127 family)